MKKRRKPPSLFDAVEAQQKKEKALQRVDAAADPRWKELALDAARTAATRLRWLTSDDVWLILMQRKDVPRQREPRAMGPIMRKAATAGFIERTHEYRNSIRSACHARPLRVWESKLMR